MAEGRLKVGVGEVGIGHMDDFKGLFGPKMELGG